MRLGVRETGLPMEDQRLDVAMHMKLRSVVLTLRKTRRVRQPLSW